MYSVVGIIVHLKFCDAGPSGRGRGDPASSSVGHMNNSESLNACEGAQAAHETDFSDTSKSDRGILSSIYNAFLVCWDRRKKESRRND